MDAVAASTVKSGFGFPSLWPEQAALISALKDRDAKAFDADASRLEIAQMPDGLDKLTASRAHRELV
ncbi:MAG: hypothetical protein C0457_19305 [Polymorphum sp.]|nr:hypothetical protein [Polymorphum sp.]